MASIKAVKNHSGEVTGYRFRACVGRDEQYKQVWRTTTIKRPAGLTPKREQKEVERLADEWEKAQRTDYYKGIATDKTRITFAQFVREKWWNDKVMNGKHTPSGISFFKYMSNDLIAYFGEKIKLSQIDVEKVLNYITFLNTKAVTKKGQPYSDATRKHHFATLRNVLEYARKIKYIDENPIHDLDIDDKPKVRNHSIDFLDAEQARKFMAALNEEPLFWRLYENILITTGLRRGEALGLQWRDIDTKKLTITIERNVTIDREADEKYHIGPTKTGEERTVPISARVLAMLIEHKREQVEKYGTLMPTAFIFNRASDPYRPVYPTEPTRWQSRFVKRHDLPDVSPHDLRHTAATLALEGGADLKQVQQLLGHKDPATTMKFYAGVSEEQQRRTVEGIEKLLG